MDKQMTTNAFIFGSISFLVGLLVASVSMIDWRMNGHDDHMEHMSMDEHRTTFLHEKDEIVGTLIAKGDYACCLEKPCTYCIEKTPGHGEGATCSCLDDVVNGKHPCGECIGEILEGHGNRFLTSYFPEAIAEEVGEQHIETIQKIIDEKYAKVE